MRHKTILRRLRDRCKLSNQTLVASELGVSKQSLCDVLAGRRHVGPKMLAGLGLTRVMEYRKPTNGRLETTNGS